MASAPRILPIKSHREIGELVARAAETLNKVTRYSRTVCLYRREVAEAVLGIWAKRRVKSKVRSGHRTEIVHAAVVDREHGLQRNVVEVGPKLSIVRADAPGKIITELVALLGALNVRVRLTSEVREPGNIDGGKRSARNRRVVKIRKAASSVLEAEIVDLVVADSPCVLRNDDHIAISLLGSSRVSVLPERLVLSTDFNSIDRAG